MAVYDAQGIVVTFEDNLAAAQVVGQIISVDFGGGTASDIDISTLSSTAREWRQGLEDFGDVTLEILRDPVDLGQAALQEAKNAQATREMVITIVGGTTFTFQAYCKSISTSGAVDAVATGTATLKVTGQIVES